MGVKKRLFQGIFILKISETAKVFTFFFLKSTVTYSQQTHSVNITHFIKLFNFFLKFRNFLGG